MQRETLWSTSSEVARSGRWYKVDLDDIGPRGGSKPLARYSLKAAHYTDAVERAWEEYRKGVRVTVTDE